MKKFKWDPEKAKTNLQKHGVSFKEASTVFLDALSLTGDDPDHSFTEDRFVMFGVSSGGRLLAVVYTERPAVIRIISARKVTRRERRFYEEG